MSQPMMRRIAVTWRDTGRRLTLTLAPGSRMLPPGTCNIEVVRGVRLQGNPLRSTKPVEVRL